jgi:hypothetical protein
MLKSHLMTSECQRSFKILSYYALTQFLDISDVQADEHASHAAEFCWLTLRRDPYSERLTRDDFMAVLNDEEDTDFTFSAFDRDQDGYVVESEVHARMQECYRCVIISSWKFLILSDWLFAAHAECMCFLFAIAY